MLRRIVYIRPYVFFYFKHQLKAMTSNGLSLLRYKIMRKFNAKILDKLKSFLGDGLYFPMKRVRSIIVLEKLF